MTTDKPTRSLVPRLLLSPYEYQLLHEYLARRRGFRSQETRLQEKHPIFEARHDFHVAALRSTLRVFVATVVGLEGWDKITRTWLARGRPTTHRKRSFLKSGNTRLAVGLSSILFLHRMLYRFFTRLRLRLFHDKAREWCTRYPAALRVLGSRVAPAIGASLAGVSLAISPDAQLRLTIAIYVGARALETLFNTLEIDGILGCTPWWFGSWLLFPPSVGQLLHAFVFDQDCFPKPFGDFILRHTPNYIPKRPSNISRLSRWPNTRQVVNTLGETARLEWPPFVSPILHPENLTPLPSTINPIISCVTSRAHPSTQYLSCAILHPSDPSCFSAYLSHNLLSFRSLTSFFALYYSAMAILSYKRFLHAPAVSFHHLVTKVLRTSATICGAIGISWGSVCLFATVLPRKLAPRFRFFLGGFLGGCAQSMNRTAAGRIHDLYAARVSAESFWKVCVKKGWVRPLPGGDIMVLVSAMALLNTIYEIRPRGCQDRSLVTMMKILRGDLEVGLAPGSKRAV